MQQSLQILAPVQVGRRLYGHLRAEYQPGSGDGPKMFLQRRLGMVRHPGVRLGPEILDNHFLDRSEEHTSELQSLMSISYAVFYLKKKNRRRATILCMTSTTYE